jgi:hypothetical protein
MIAFELPVPHRPNSAFVMRDIAAELLTITQQIRDRSVHGFSTDEIAALDTRREELHVLYDAAERLGAFSHKHND